MTFRNHFLKATLCVFSLLLLFALQAANAQEPSKDSGANATAASKDPRITIVVTGGDEKKPIDSASVYVRYVEEHKHLSLIHI